MKKPSWSRKKTRNELEAALQRQIGHLRRSCELYDARLFDEAERLAQTVYTLVHDGWGKTKSLLGQLQLKNELIFLDSTEFDLDPADTVFGGLPLCYIALSEVRVEHRPLCWKPAGLRMIHGPPAKLAFEEWWKQNIYQTRDGKMLDRKGLVLELRLRDGGGHVDAALESETYDDLARNANRTWTADNGSLPLGGAHWASMRQIAWELDESLKVVGF